MSERRSLTDTQALLQSMLQRLRLQPGSDAQGQPRHLSPTSATQDPSWGAGGGGPNGVPYFKGPGAVGGREMRRWDSREEFGIPVWGGDFGVSGPTDTTTHGAQGVPLTHPSAMENADSHVGKMDASGQVPWPVATLTGVPSGQGFPSCTNRDLTLTDIGSDVISCRRRRKLKISLKGGGSDKQPSHTEGGSGRKEEGDRKAWGEGRGQSAAADPNRGWKAESTDTGVPNHHDKQVCQGSSPVRYDDITPVIGNPSPPGLTPLTFTVSAATRNSRTPRQNQDHASPSQVQVESGFTPRVYAWSLRSTDPGLDTGSPAESLKNRHSAQNSVVGMFASNQGAGGSTSLATRKKKLVSESLTKRWTQRIKERWREKHSSFKRRETKASGKKNETEVNLSGECAVTKMSNGDRTPQALIREVQGEAPPSQSEEGFTAGHHRSSTDLDFSLGSFSLMDEILTGQEWASFVNPAQTDVSANERPDEANLNWQCANQGPQSQGIDQSALTMNIQSKSGTTNPQWDFRPTETGGVSDQDTTQLSTDDPVPVSMDVLEPSLVHEHNAEFEAIQSEPMEHSDDQSQPRHDEARANLARQLDFSIQPEGFLDNSALKNRVYLNRKRVHQSQERRGEREQREMGKEDENGRSRTKTVVGQATEGDGGGMKVEDRLATPLCSPGAPRRSLPSSFSSSSSTVTQPSPAPAYRGVLKHSVSRDSESSISMETVTKKRRMSYTRHVRFSEEVVTIVPSISDVTDEEEDSGTEEESSAEEEDSGMQEEEKVVSAPRHSLPAWILALKKRKTVRNPRH